MSIVRVGRGPQSQMNRRTLSTRRRICGSRFFARLSLSGLILMLSPMLLSPADSGTLIDAKAAASDLSSELESAGWRLLDVPGKAKAEFTKRSHDSIGVRADTAVAFLYRSVDDDMGPKRRLVWNWRIDETVPPTDLTRAPGDDRSLAVHLVFPVHEDRLSLWERMDLALTRLVAPPMAGKVLTYVWGGTHPEGSVLSNPYLDKRGKIIVLRSGDGPVGQWFMEEIDFVADFRMAFGYRPPAPVFLAISADSDDTGSRIFGAVADLTFKG